MTVDGSNTHPGAQREWDDATLDTAAALATEGGDRAGLDPATASLVEQFDAAAAALDVGLTQASGEIEPMPADLFNRVQASALSWAAERREALGQASPGHVGDGVGDGLSSDDPTDRVTAPPSVSEAPPAPPLRMAATDADPETHSSATGSMPAPPPRRDRNWFTEHGGMGWVLAAAAIALAVFIGVDQAPNADQPSPDGLRAQLLAEAPPDLIRLDWTAPEGSQLAGVDGDVVWSDQRQEGYMRLVNMPPNDPQVQQYQLWVVDPDVDEHPVDGGVFDVRTDAGEVIVPIDAKLAIDNPAVFAITIERPGGVVVSEGPLHLVAAPES